MFYGSWSSIGCRTRRLDFAACCSPFELSSRKGVVDCRPNNYSTLLSSSFLSYFMLCFDGLHRFASCLLWSCSLAIRTDHLRRSSSIAAPGISRPVQRSRYRFYLHQNMALNLAFLISLVLSSKASVSNSLFVQCY